MKHYLLVAALAIPVMLGIGIFVLGVGSQRCHAQSKSQSGTAPRSPVLVELFTSEGCSDCPPADRLLENLDRSQPVPGADIIVLSEHVDYWNRLGWMDRFSSSFYSERQSSYAERFGLDSVYTPEMVVDGGAEFVGSNARRAQSAIADAARKPKLGLRLLSVKQDKGAVTARLESDILTGNSVADVYLVLADETDTSDVKRGENSGRTLTHVAVAREFKKLGSIQPKKNFAEDAKLELLSDEGDRRSLRLIAFVQEQGSQKVLAAASLRIGNTPQVSSSRSQTVSAGVHRR